MAKTASVIVTRPGEAGRALAEALRAEGLNALYLPAFDLGSVPNEAAARAVLKNLHAFDLAVFVSPAAVSATAKLLPQPWPAHLPIGVVGSGSRAAVLRDLPGGKGADILAPQSDADASGSEALWNALLKSGRSVRSVLVLRAVSGRDWLPQQLRCLGARVETLAVYSRQTHAVSEQESHELRALLAQRDCIAAVFSSSEAVDALRAQLANIEGGWACLQQALALATHARIAARLAEAGFARVMTVLPRADAVLAAVRHRL